MPKFRVMGTATIEVDIEIDAEDSDEAMDRVHESGCYLDSDLEADLIEE